MQHFEERGEAEFEIAPVDDEVKESMIEHEFGALEAFWEVFADGFADDARAGEAY